MFVILLFQASWRKVRLSLYTFADGFGFPDGYQQPGKV
jgi:hypothetical protein